MTKFSDLKLDPKVLKAVSEAGYENPTPIQAGAIPPALEGRDVLGIAQTGTGKTASFTLPMITLLGRGRARARMPRSLVLCPTRELAAQVAENFDTYAKHTRLTKALLIGGVSFGEQDKLIDRGVDVLIATPGRLLDHFERGKLLLTGVQIMVVDEADRMLDMGFIPDIERIFQLTPFTRQTLFFSATMAPEIERITDTFLHSPERIEVARQATTSETITQKLVEITPTRRDQSAKQKRELLRALIRAEGEGLKNAIIFCNRKTDVDIVAKSLKAHGFDAAPIHGDLDQRHRMATLDEFREGKLRLLVASDVAARGLDIPAVSHVINFDLPSHAEDYVHRIGRTGRAGREGTAISIGTPADEKYLTAIESLVKQTLPRVELPEGFTLSAAAQEAPRAPRENGRRGGRDRDRDRGERGERGERDRSRRGRRDDSEQRPATDETKTEARAESPDRRNDQPERRRDREDQRPDRREDRNDARREDRRDDRREERRGDRRDDRRDDRRGDRHQVMGMGDHLPEFMTRSFRPSFVEPAEEKPAAAAAEKPAAVAPEAIATPIETAVPVEASGVVEAVEPAAEAQPAKEKPARKRKPRTTKAKADATETPVEAAGTPAEAQPQAEAATEDAAAPAEKPKRKAAKAPAKPRAPRKTKAKADAAAADAPAAEAVAAAPTETPAES
ncbi:DEAD/DEAH box helicase [Paracoccus lutimaris]|uniref:DEAD-box ATP-dependent RNA helicase RhpA n=1 Tax=Paracoccus lutimaris TaxID=1490030 RepID=A0A368YWV6_9RHOB|nr:superfamily II DNA/RNA helicase [Paracoccus lutimaris]